MRSQAATWRIVLVVLDGLRPDAIGRFDLGCLNSLIACGAWTLDARTVSPSVTVAAVTSLMTGISPAMHGLVGDRVFIPRSRRSIVPLPELLAAQDYPLWGFMRQLPLVFRGVAGRVGRRLGLRKLHLHGACAEEVLASARQLLRKEPRGLFVLHWPDADTAGHDAGWMSPAYAAACRRLDSALTRLVDDADDGNTMLVLVADHGGGGTIATDHESSHPAARTIPLILWGAGVAPTWLDGGCLLDIPATILTAFGMEPPSWYMGRALVEALARTKPRGVAVA